MSDNIGFCWDLILSTLSFEDWVERYGCPENEQPCLGCHYDYDYYLSCQDKRIEEFYSKFDLCYEDEFGVDRFEELVPTRFQRFI
jgi:hypothetical protein